MFGRSMNSCALVLGLTMLGSVKLPHALAEDLSKQWQLRVEQRYREFEGSLEKLADALRATDPVRAELLSKAFRESKKELVVAKLRELITQIERGEIKQAVSQQDQVISDMHAVLQLLLSEDRTERVEERRAKLEMYAKQVRQLTDEQRRIRSATEAMETAATEEIEKQQASLAQQTKRMRAGDKFTENKSRPRDRSEEEHQPTKESPDHEDQDSTAGANTDKSSESPPSSNDSKSKPKSLKSNSSPSQRQDGEKESAASPARDERDDTDENSPPPSMPGDEHLTKAAQSMKAARQKIREKEKELALREQDNAIQELEKSTEQLKKELEELREEEKTGKLSDLEERLRQILGLEQVIYNDTLTLDKSAGEKRSRSDEQKGLELSRSQREIIGQLDQVLGILLADGTAVAFPETIEQISRDGEVVAKRLAVCDTGNFTQHVEKDILDSLTEMIQSLQRELGKKREENPSKNGESGNDDSTKSPLVEELSELKMVRSLQHRINERTNALRQSKQNGDAPSAELNQALRDLADRQKRVYQITRDVARERTP